MNRVVSYAIFVAFVAGGLLWNAIGCHGRWELSGLRAEYRLASGCMVKLADGRVLPEGSLREMNITPKGKP